MTPVPSDTTSDTTSDASASDAGSHPWPTPTHLASIRAAFELAEDCDR